MRLGSAWNFEIKKIAPVDVEKFTKSISRMPVIGIASPGAKVNSTILGTNIEVNYSRPLKRGREIFGYVVPYNRVWRAGANHATQISFDKDLVFGGELLRKGKYNLFVVPKEKDSWTLIFNIEENAFGSAYDKKYDLVSVNMQVNEAPKIVEQFTIEIKENENVGELLMTWDNVIAKVVFELRI